MMDNSDIGESSCRRKPNNDKMSDSERPLKKAKFAWQVKGRYHLREQEEVSDNSGRKKGGQNMDDSNIGVIVDNKGSDDPELSSKAEENLEILGDYLLKQQDLNRINSLIITPSETCVSVEKPTPLHSDDAVPHENNASDMTDFQSDNKVPVRNKKFNNDLAPSSSYNPLADDLIYDPSKPASPLEEQRQHKTEDLYLARWQNMQIAKCFVDNTINRVLDSWLVAPLPTTCYNHSIAMDVAEFFDNLPANSAIENEGILMAISAHGLQNNQPQEEEDNSRESRFTSQICTIGLPDHSSRSFSNNSPSRDCLQSNSTSDTEENGHNIYPARPASLSNHSPDIENNNSKDRLHGECNSSSEPSAWRQLSQPCNCSHNPRRQSSVPNIPFHRRDNTDSSGGTSTQVQFLTCQEEVPNDHAPSIGPKILACISDKSSSSDSSENEEEISKPIYPLTEALQQPFDEDFDFMDAAVSFAIQNKGLTSFSSVDYG